jgi:hypothetical protein
MPTIKFGKHVSDLANAADDVADGGYSGPIPTERGVYSCYVKIFDLVTNKNGDPMLKGLAVVDVPKKHKFAKYNGYGIWFQQNITDQGKPFVNQLLSALSDGSAEHAARIRKAFWTVGAQTEKPLPAKPQQSAGAILKIGPLRFMDLDDKKIRILISGKPVIYNSEPKLEAGKYVMKQVEEVVDEDDEDEDTGEELDTNDPEESTELYDDEDSDEDEDEDDDDEDEDEDEDPYEDVDGEDEVDTDGEDSDGDEDEEEEEAPVTHIRKKAADKGAKRRGEPAF